MGATVLARWDQADGDHDRLPKETTADKRTRE